MILPIYQFFARVLVLKDNTKEKGKLFYETLYSVIVKCVNIGITHFIRLKDALNNLKTKY